ncbi:hypothetical protein BH10PSE6_BH10PSE6_01010 [soil metagenome]
MLAMKPLLIATAIIEAGAGLALLCLPASVALLLFGTPLDTPTALSVARLGGLGLLALGVACWLARDDARGPAAQGLAKAMVVYNAGAAGLFAYAAVGVGLQGVLLWPAAALHAIMSAWCIARSVGTR